jgi:hypothetical protein
MRVVQKRSVRGLQPHLPSPALPGSQQKFDIPDRFSAVTRPVLTGSAPITNTMRQLGDDFRRRDPPDTCRIHATRTVSTAAGQSRQISRLLALEHSSGIDASLAIHIGKIDAIARQAASRGKLAKVVHRRHLMARRQGHKLGAARVEKWISGHEKRVDVLLSDGFVYHVDLAIGARPQHLNF